MHGGEQTKMQGRWPECWISPGRLNRCAIVRQTRRVYQRPEEGPVDAPSRPSSEKVLESARALGGRPRGTRRVDKLQGARNNEAPVLGRTAEIGPSRGYKSHGTTGPEQLLVKRPIDAFQGARRRVCGTRRAASAAARVRASLPRFLLGVPVDTGRC